MFTPKIIKLIFTKHFFQKLLVIVILILWIYFLRDFLILFLWIFLLSYLFSHLWNFLHKNINSYLLSENSKFLKIISKIITFKIIIIFLYLIFITLIVFAISDLIPALINELKNIQTDIPIVWNQIESIISDLKKVIDINTDFQWSLKEVFTERNYNILIKLFDSLKSFWGFILQFILAIIISFIVIIDQKKILKFLKPIKKWDLDFIYREYKVLFLKVRKWFWLIFKAQATIAAINTMITVVGYYLIWLAYWGFPYLLTMAIVVFICSFVPVLWMWLSAIPLCFIAFTVWWIDALFLIFIMIILTTSFEVYVLNPKIVSSYLEFPISVTFIILIVSEHIFWLIWLLVWVPLFYILIDLIKDFTKYVSKLYRKYKKIS